jgi:hypothetical protein
MKPMIWRPEEKDKQVNEYLEHENHAPYPTIIMSIFGVFCLATILILISSF